MTSPKVTDARSESLPNREVRGGTSGREVKSGVNEGRSSARNNNNNKDVSTQVAPNPVLREIVKEARLATTATGAFIATVRSDKVVAQAINGSNSGEFVAYLNRDQRILDSCFHSGTVLSCRDWNASEDLDVAVCRYLGVRSVVLIPVLGEADEKLGIFGIFSPQADAFSAANFVALQALARRSADALVHADLSTPVSLSFDVPQPVPGPTLLSGDEPLGTERRSFQFVSPAIWGIAIVAVVVLAGWLVMRAFSHREASGATKAPTAVSQNAQNQDNASHAASFVTTQSASNQAASDQPTADNKIATSTSAPATTTNSKPTVPSSVAAVKPVPATPLASKAKSKILAQPKSRVPDLVIENALDDNTASFSPQPANIVKAVNRPSTAAVSTMESGRKIIAANNGAAGPSSAPREAIHLIRAPEPPSATTPGLETSTQGSSAADAIGPSGQVMIPEKAALDRVSDRVEPEYSDEAKTDHVQGNVTVDIVISKDGQVESATALDGDPRLQASAVKAVRKWHFAPLLRNGHFSSFESHITLHFALP